MEQWLALPGMKPRQIIMVLPAVGFWFRCDSKDPTLAPGKCKVVSSNRISHNRAHNLRCGPTGRGPGSPPCLPSAHHSPNVSPQAATRLLVITSILALLAGSNSDRLSFTSILTLLLIDGSIQTGCL